MYFLGKFGGWTAQQKLWEYIEKEFLSIYPLSDFERSQMAKLMAQYRDTPMDLADASLVIAAQTLHENKIFTLDSDFRIYRLTGGQSFEMIP
jgi:uncharacterized protein